MTKEELTEWALANGWQIIAGHPSLIKPTGPVTPIVRLILKATVAALEIKTPAGRWEKIASESYSKIVADEDNGIPGGLGLATIPRLGTLMQDNRDRQMIAKMGGG